MIFQKNYISNSELPTFEASGTQHNTKRLKKRMKKSNSTVGLVLLVFFVISLLTNILGALNPGIKESFNLEFSSLGFMTLAFWSQTHYGIISIILSINSSTCVENSDLIKTSCNLAH